MYNQKDLRFPQDPEGPFQGASEWPERLYDDVDGKNEPDAEDNAPGSWKIWDFQFSKREPFMLKADWYLGSLLEFQGLHADV